MGITFWQVASKVGNYAGGKTAGRPHPGREHKEDLRVWDTSLDFGLGIQPHVHEDFEEVYYILSGKGRMRIGEEEEEVGGGALIYIPPGKVHTIVCTSTEPLRFITLTVAVGMEEESPVPPYIA